MPWGCNQLCAPASSSPPPSPSGEKREFYERYGIKEYDIYNPDAPDLAGMLHEGDKLRVHSPMDEWTSPRLGIRFDMSGEDLRIFAPDGQPFVSFSELKRQHEEAEQRAKRLAARLCFVHMHILRHMQSTVGLLCLLCGKGNLLGRGVGHQPDQ